MFHVYILKISYHLENIFNTLRSSTVATNSPERIIYELVRVQYQKNQSQTSISLKILTRTNAAIKNVRTRSCNDSIDSSMNGEFDCT